MEKLYSVTELAKALDVTARALRFHEDRGLISPQPAGKTRDWRDLYDADPEQVAQTARLRDKVRARIAALEVQRADLDATLGELKDILGYEPGSKTAWPAGKPPPPTVRPARPDTKRKGTP